MRGAAISTVNYVIPIFNDEDDDQIRETQLDVVKAFGCTIWSEYAMFLKEEGSNIIRRLQKPDAA